jgi:hypothetical protein
MRLPYTRRDWSVKKLRKPKFADLVVHKADTRRVYVRTLRQTSQDRWLTPTLNFMDAELMNFLADNIFHPQLCGFDLPPTPDEGI